MHLYRTHFFLILVFLSLVAISSAKAQTIDTQTGFNDIQKPFSEFLNSATQIDIGQVSESSTISLPNSIETQNFWQTTDNWLKEKTGLDIWGFLKMIGNILLFVLNLVVNILATFMKILQWLLSLIPGSTTTP